MMTAAVLPGDVLAVRTSGRPAWWIRLGAALKDEPNLSNHIAVAHHTDKAGTYARAGLPHPGGDRLCQPGDWDAFIINRSWEEQG